MSISSRFNPFRFLQPQAVISEPQLNAGLRWLTLEGMVSMGFTSIIGSGFLAAFALALGADNFQIGLLASIPSITQMLQILAVFLVEKLRWRKAITISTWFVAQLFWFPIAVIPFLAPIPSTEAVLLLLGLMTIRGLLAAFTSCGWNTWVCDLVPRNILGHFFARRSILATLATVAFGLGGAAFVDFWAAHSGGHAVQGYTYVIAFGALFMGMMSPLIMTLIPEPVMQPSPCRITIGQTLIAPLRDKNFKWLLGFLFSWSFASNLALPFFSVFMLQKIGLPVSLVIAFYVLSQLFNIIFLRVWGALVDRAGNKVVLSLSSSLYLLVIFGWIFTMMPGRYFLTIPLLIILNIFAGIASAGVGLTTSTIGLKLVPRDKATSYLSSVSLTISLGAGLGPLLGGFLADYFSQRQLNLALSWTDPAHSMQLSALNITGFSFLFIIAFILGLLTLGLLARLREEGEESREVVLDSLMTPMRDLYRPVSSILPYHISEGLLYRYLKRIPIPGLDVALSVAAYQVADTARFGTNTARWSWKTVKSLIKSTRPPSGNGIEKLDVKITSGLKSCAGKTPPAPGQQPSAKTDESTGNLKQ